MSANTKPGHRSAPLRLSENAKSALVFSLVFVAICVVAFLLHQ